MSISQADEWDEKKMCYIHDCTIATIYTFGVNCKELIDLKVYL